MDIRSLFEQTMSSAKNLFTFRTQKKFVTKLACYNFFNKRIRTKCLLYVKQMSTKVAAIFSKVPSFLKNILSKMVGVFSQSRQFLRHSYVNFRIMVGTLLSRLKTNRVRFGKFIFAQRTPLKAHSSRLMKHFAMRRMQYSLFVGFFGVTAILGFCAHIYFKHQNFDELENIPVIKSLAFRLTQTESKLRDAQAQIQAMSSLEHEVKQTASKLGETEESLKERLAKAEHKVEEIDTIGESLKLAGLKSLISKNKKKASHKIKSLSEKSNDLDNVKEKIRKEVKRQMKVLEAGDNNSF